MIFPKLQRPPPLLIDKGHFTKKNSLAHYLSYATLVTNVPAGYFFNVFSLSRHKLVSAQTAKPSSKTRNCRYYHQDFLIKYFFSLICDNDYSAEEHTAVTIQY